MTRYSARELPNLDDPALVQCCACAQRMRRTLSAFFRHVVSQLSHKPVTTATRVALAIVDRMVEGSLSTELLCMKNRVRDAAVLLLNLYELQLDLQFIARDLSRAETRIAHERKDKKPCKVKRQLSELYAAPNELEAESWLYRTLSMVKHCNPAGRNFSFPIAVTPDTIQLDLDGKNSPMVRAHLFALGTCIHHVGDAASRIWADKGLDIGDFTAELQNQCD